MNAIRFLLLVACGLAACQPTGPAMKFTPLANMPGWSIGPEVQEGVVYDEPPSDLPGFIVFYGMRATDQRHHFYRIPAETPLAEVVTAFQVGAHGAQSYSYDVAETVRLVSSKATRIAEITPCRVTFADAAGLKLKFLRPITDPELERLAALFPEEEQMQAGLDRYIADWDGESPLLRPVKEENMIHLWWD